MERHKGGSSAARLLKKSTSMGSKQSGDSFTSSSSIKEIVDASEKAPSEGTEAQRALRKVASRGDSESGASGKSINPKGQKRAPGFGDQVQLKGHLCVLLKCRPVWHADHQ